MDALTSAATYFDGHPATVIPPQVEGADQAVLIVYNAFGTEVARRNITPNAADIQFDGIGSDGAILQNGFYSYQVTSLREGYVLQTDPAFSYGHIEEARSENGRVMLLFAGGALADSGTVRGLRAPR